MQPLMKQDKTGMNARFELPVSDVNGNLGRINVTWLAEIYRFYQNGRNVKCHDQKW